MKKARFFFMIAHASRADIAWRQTGQSALTNARVHGRVDIFKFRCLITAAAVSVQGRL